MLPSFADAFRDDLLEWGQDNIRSFPWRDFDRSFYEVFVAEFFLTQTPAENVATVFPEFVEQYPDLETIAATDETDLAAAIEPLGFQNRRAKALMAIAAGKEYLPRTRDGLLALPRVGPYVADATLCFALAEPRTLVDRNVRRVYARVFGTAWPESEDEQRTFAETLLPDDGVTARRYNMVLLDFGAMICQPDTPACNVCFATSYCRYYTRMEQDGERSDAKDG